MHARGLRPRRARSMLAISHSSMLPSAHWNSVGTLISDHFHGSIPCLHVPLSTLHVQPCDCPRMTRGQVGSLRLACTTLAFATSRRFIPAHSNFGPIQEGGCVTFSAVSDTRCSTYLIFTAFLTAEPPTSSELAGVGTNRRKSAS